jgi:hypothetical protein
MNEEAIHRALEHADRALAPPASEADAIILGVHRKARHRVRRRVVGGGVLAVACVMATVVLLMRGQQPVTPQQPSPEELTQRLAAMEAEIAQLRAQAGYLLAREREARTMRMLSQPVSEPDIGEALDAQMEPAAGIMVRHAHRLENRFGRPDEALADYRRVDELFPNTTWAVVAREGIRRLESQSEGERQ